MPYDAAATWNSIYTAEGDSLAYPAEGVIRIFKGSFPKLHMPKPQAGNSILDVGCGDGRHLLLFHALGMRISAVEITDEITTRLQQRMKSLDVPADIRTGHVANLPFDDEKFDYLLTWNSCYYMSLSDTDFQNHVSEMARTLSSDGWIVGSIPKKNNFIFKNSEPHTVPGYRIIRDDPFGSRNGEVMRCMESREDLEHSFASHFDSFCHADLDMDWFGLSYRWHVFAAQRKSDANQP